MTSHAENCAICHTDFSDKKIFQCHQCQMKCHQECYLYSEDQVKSQNIKNCDVCKLSSATPDEKKFKRELKCLYCDKNQGILKKCISEKKAKWIHINCAYWNMKTLNLEMEGGTHVFISKSIIQGSFMEECLKCKKTISDDIIVKCQSKDCQKYYHTRCIEESLKRIDELGVGLKQYTFYCDKHYKIGKIHKSLYNCKTYGKNINSEIEGDLKINKIVKDYDYYNFNNNQEIILQTAKNNYNIMRAEKKLERILLPKEKVNNNKNEFSNFSIKNIKNEEFNSEIINEPSDYFVSTVIKCDICTGQFDDKENFNQCSECLTYYHQTCAKEFGEPHKKCKKYLNDKENNMACLVCERTEGSMIKCDYKWVHILCAIILKKYFYHRKDQSTYSLSLEAKQNKIQSECGICNLSNCYTIKCNKCELNFHPYCGFMFNFEFVCKENKGLTDLLNKYEILTICESHKFYLEKDNENKIKIKNKIKIENLDKESNFREVNKKEINYDSPKNTKKLFRNNFKRLKLHSERIKSIQLESFNFKELKNLISQKVSNPADYSNLTKWDWKISDNYFFNFNEKEVSSLNNKNVNEKSSQDNLNNLIDSLGISINNNTSNRNDFILCYFKTNSLEKYKEYLSVYDISKINEMKLSPDFVNYHNHLTYLNSSHDYSFLNKRKRTEDENIITHENKTFNNFLNKKNIKVIYDEDEIMENIIENKSKPSSTKIKFSFNEMEVNGTSQNNIIPINSSYRSNNSNIEIESEKKNSTSDSTKSKKFLRKIKLMSYYKLRKKDKEVLNLEESSIRKIKKVLYGKESLSLENFDDIDKEILIKSEMLENIKNTNSEKMNKIYQKIYSEIKELSDNKYYNNIEENSKIISTFKSVNKYGNIKRRLKRGVEEDKSVEDLVRNRSYGTKQIVAKMDDESKETFVDSECCICFYTETDETNNNPIVFCDSCNVSVHQECYGITNIPEGDYFCDLCQYKKTDENKKKLIECVLCCNTNGAMKRLDNYNWAHVTCIFVSSFLSFINYSTMDLVIGFKNQFKNKSNIICEVCKKSNGELFKISGGQTYYHFLCAYLDGFKIIIKEDTNYENRYIRRLRPIIYSFDPTSEILLETFRKQKELRNSIYHKEITNFKRKEKKHFNMIYDFINCTYEKFIGNISEYNNTTLEDLVGFYNKEFEEEINEMEIENEMKNNEIKCSICLEDLYHIDIIKRCSTCQIISHEKCFNLFYTQENEICEFCSELKIYSKLKSPSCLLCSNKGGAVIKYHSIQLEEKLKNYSPFWIHIFCRESINILIQKESELINPKILNFFTCSICNSKKGFLIKCVFEDCECKFHSYCAAKLNFNKEKVENDINLYYCKFHSVIYEECTTNSISPLINEHKLIENEINEKKNLNVILNSNGSSSENTSDEPKKTFENILKLKRNKYNNILKTIKS